MTINSGLKSVTTHSDLAEAKDKKYMYGVLRGEHDSLSWESGTPDLLVGDRVEIPR